MQVLSGNLPTERRWRVLVLLSPNDDVTLAWQLGLMLARANEGELLACVILGKDEDQDSADFHFAQKTLDTVSDYCRPSDAVEKLIVKSLNPQRTLHELVGVTDTDLVLTSTDGPLWQSLGNLPCTVGVLRGGAETKQRVSDKGIEHILVPSAGGPNTAYALQFLKQLPSDVAIEALFISRTDQGLHEEALGKANLEQVLRFADADERVTAKVARYASPSEGIVQQAGLGCDLVVMGASRESSLDKVLFGNIVNSVVRQSQVPVLIVRQPHRRRQSVLSQLDWQLQRVIPRLTAEQRDEVYVRLRTNSKPDLDYFALITLSAAIAALGLFANSAAVVIGAMLVAPLMAPIVATGMALILGDLRFLRLGFGSTVRGVLVAVAVGALVGLLPGNAITDEVIARTAPNLIDLGIAIFSGLAGAFATAYFEQAAGALPGVAIAVALVPPLASVGIAFAEGDWQKGLGASLLFLTNFVAIVVASALVFLVFGFRPNPTQKVERRVQARSAKIALILMGVVTILLAGATIGLAQDTRRTTIINQVTEEKVQEVLDGSPQLEGEPIILNAGDPLTFEVTVRSAVEPTNVELLELQEAIALELRDQLGLRGDVQLSLTHIRTSTVNEFTIPTVTLTLSETIPLSPTPFPTVTPTFTPTSEPIAVATDVPTLEPSPTATVVPTDIPSPVPTNTPRPTSTPTPTVTPLSGDVMWPYGLNMRAEPSADSELLNLLVEGTTVTLLDVTATDDQDRLWRQIRYDGATGWVLAEFVSETP